MFQTRIKKLQRKLGRDLDGLLITSPSNIAYLTGVRNFSKEEREAFALVTKNNFFVFTDKRYTDALAPLDHISLQEISHQDPITKHLIDICTTHNIKSLGFEKEYLTYYEFESLHKKFTKQIKTLELFPTDGIVESLRMIKDKHEIENLRRAGSLTDLAFQHIVRYIHAGISEYELATELEYFIKKRGGGIAFPTIAAFGTHSAVPHHETGGEKLQEGQVILLDFGAAWNGYCADMTRTVFLGKADPELKKMYLTVKEAQQKAIDKLGSSTPKSSKGDESLLASHVDSIARKYIIKQSYPSIPHSVGHGVGLQVHELPHISPKNKTELKPGMVITVEPGIYDIKIGGIRIEDDVVITKTGIELLTNSTRDIIEL